MKGNEVPNFAIRPTTSPATAIPTKRSALLAMKFAIPERKDAIAPTKLVATDVRAELISE
ncbi:hypothetical protein [Saccharolobus sp.]|uniref:hypothetical protein n=1 Tax=Saccharolobus sp. TaxID=2100761 RepID=UPI003173A931